MIYKLNNRSLSRLDIHNTRARAHTHEAGTHMHTHTNTHMKQAHTCIHMHTTLNAQARTEREREREEEEDRINNPETDRRQSLHSVCQYTTSLLRRLTSLNATCLVHQLFSFPAIHTAWETAAVSSRGDSASLNTNPLADAT